MADDDKKDEQELSEDEKLAAEWEAAMEESGDAEEGDAAEESGSGEDEWAAAMAEADSAEQDNVQTAPMEEFDHNGPVQQGDGLAPDLDVILDIPVTISMEVGNTQIPIRNLLQLNQGSVIELDRLAGEPLDVLVNGTLIAHGEVVMVNEKFGIRLTDVISPGERIKRLQK
ncbi:MAG: flagellar motor switch protein FliN [Gammaproteobacteria bacterium]|uniref:Flagellar motor switch protein FliN n=1 Tax=Marinobacter nitratireducens TaxID=1137280 RepID=A0A072N4L6_9GAMM|nr:flagellar motor switch protein FliN [Marinobacter nitratireducens]KEF31933.1 Flagellar motor switch protein FliN [Marinobacter nitratireducens]TNE75197.1 MAG: flagellar motor switch protein FliN [Gammaproteobacteria bacterium]TNE93485.1 MAG: flagellar motor switch protein FliN [Gammaproteobacteria bacterium]